MDHLLLGRLLSSQVSDLSSLFSSSLGYSLDAGSSSLFPGKIPAGKMLSLLGDVNSLLVEPEPAALLQRGAVLMREWIGAGVGLAGLRDHAGAEGWRVRVSNPAGWGVDEDNPPWIEGCWEALTEAAVAVLFDGHGLAARLDDVEGQAVGMLVAAGKPSGLFTAEDEGVALQLAGLVSHALQQLQRVDELERRAMRAEKDQAALDALLNYLPAGVTIASAVDNKLQRMSRYGLELLDYLPSGVEGVSITDHLSRFTLYESDGKSVIKPEQNPLSQIRLNGEPILNKEFWFRRGDGTMVCAIYNAGPIFDAERAITGMVSVWQDITPLKAAQQEQSRLLEDLRQDHKLLEMVMETVPVAIVVVRGPELRYELVNAAYEELVKTRREQLIGHPMREVFPFMKDSNALREILGIYETGTGLRLSEYPWEFEGKAFWGNAHILPLPDLNGNVERLLMMVHDITARKMSEVKREELLVQVEQERRWAQQQAEWLEAVFDALEESVISYGPDGEVVYFNRAAERVFRGRVFNEDIGKLSEKSGLCYRDGRSVERNDLPSIRSLKGEVVRRVPLLLKIPEEKDIFIEGSATPLYDGEKVIGGVVVWRDVTAELELKTQLEAERSRFKALVEAAPEGIVAMDQEGRVIFANPVMQQLVKCPIPYNEPVGEPLARLFIGPDGTPYSARELPFVRSALDGEATRNLEIDIQWPDGQRRPLLVNTAPILDSQGQRIGAVGLMQDISDLKAAREALQDSLRLLQALHELDQNILSGLPIEEILKRALVDMRSLLHFGVGELSIFELRAGKIVTMAVQGWGVSASTVGCEYPESAAWFLAQLKAGEIAAIGMAEAPDCSPLVGHLREAGILFYINVPLWVQDRLIGSLNLGLCNPHYLDSGLFSFLREFASQLAIGLQQSRLLDQVDRYTRVLEAMAEKREAQFKAIFEATPLGIVLTDIRGRITTLNPAVERLMGYSALELHGQSLAKLFHPEDSGVKEAFDEVSLQSQRISERRYLCRDGQVRWANVTATMIEHLEVAGPLWLYVIEDITDRRQIQAALLQAEKLTTAGKMAASLAHEINNPLQTVIGCLGLLEEMLEPEQSARRYLQVAGDELLRASRIVSQLRDLNHKVQPGGKQRVEINRVLEQVLLVSQKQCHQQNVEVVWKPGANLPVIRAVPDQLNQVFLNLVINAVEAMPEGGRLKVGSEWDGATRQICLTFQDSGKGVPPELLENFFNPFFTTKPDGVGLGLFVSYNIIKEHQGQIQVDSRVNVGTTFRIWFPGEGET